ncbi:biopolymer transporter ExbD [uncultured Photobacterium sp.]|uniref:ExbD/TolR family protein n=1 Tax=uncultured Photobacterium sp. TaxID=173973 RepID=UPI00260A0AC6|nr:biopolymer transporter ExbD [uncultured Photobacterium sp.]
MRNYHSTDNQDSVDINMTPLIDMVFILLIFFLVSASFTKLNSIEVNRPDSSISDTQTAKNIVVSIDQEGTIWLDKNPIDIRFVKSEIKSRAQQSEQVSVVINADSNVATGKLIETLDQVRLAGVSNVAVATNKKS